MLGVHGAGLDPGQKVVRASTVLVAAKIRERGGERANSPNLFLTFPVFVRGDGFAFGFAMRPRAEIWNPERSHNAFPSSYLVAVGSVRCAVAV